MCIAPGMTSVGMIPSICVPLVSSMFEEIVSIVPQAQKQEVDVDCGASSIAMATSLLHGFSSGPYIQ